jgi:hypothetical protein
MLRDAMLRAIEGWHPAARALVAGVDLESIFVIPFGFLEPADVRHVLLNGFKSAFLPFREKGEMTMKAVREIDEVFRAAHAGAKPEWDLL